VLTTSHEDLGGCLLFANGTVKDWVLKGEARTRKGEVAGVKLVQTDGEPGNRKETKKLLGIFLGVGPY